MALLQLVEIADEYPDFVSTFDLVGAKVQMPRSDLDRE
jgi:hypothetical protein